MASSLSIPAVWGSRSKRRHAEHGTHVAQFATEVLPRGAAAVFPQHLPDRWLDALLEEADLLAPEEGDPAEGARVADC
ncbi:MAG TPA: hypothetical protein VI542_30320 [Candidatus Tectomicrobia bacterium]